ncbi:MAG: putative quinone binding protein, partial [uncultured Thermomicrobiales bacterium]
ESADHPQARAARCCRLSPLGRRHRLRRGRGVRSADPARGHHASCHPGRHARPRHRRPVCRRSESLACLLPTPWPRHPRRRRHQRRRVPAQATQRADLLLGDLRLHPPRLPRLPARPRRPQGLARVRLRQPGGSRHDVRDADSGRSRRLLQPHPMGQRALRRRRRPGRQPDRPALPARLL